MKSLLRTPNIQGKVYRLPKVQLLYRGGEVGQRYPKPAMCQSRGAYTSTVLCAGNEGSKVKPPGCAALLAQLLLRSALSSHQQPLEPGQWLIATD